MQALWTRLFGAPAALPSQSPQPSLATASAALSDREMLATPSSAAVSAVQGNAEALEKVAAHAAPAALTGKAGMADAFEKIGAAVGATIATQKAARANALEKTACDSAPSQLETTSGNADLSPKVCMPAARANFGIVKGAGDQVSEKTVEALAESASVALAKMVESKVVRLELHPGCVWKSDKDYICGPISRVGGGSAREVPAELVPKGRIGLTAAVLYFTLETDSETDFKQMASLARELQLVDGVQIKNHHFLKPETVVKRTLKPEFANAAAESDQKDADNEKKIRDALQLAAQLGANTEDVVYPCPTPHPSIWYDIQTVVSFKAAHISIACDLAHTTLFRVFVERDLVEPAIPEWYRAAKF
jgi:hypothetical protein